MKFKPVAWVATESPFQGATFAVHRAIAESCTAKTGYEFEMILDSLALKARVGRASVDRALKRLLEGPSPYLELVTAGGGRGLPSRYRMLFPGLDPRLLAEQKPHHPEGVSKSKTTSKRGGIDVVSKSRKSPKSRSTPSYKALSTKNLSPAYAGEQATTTENVVSLAKRKSERDAATRRAIAAAVGAYMDEARVNNWKPIENLRRRLGKLAGEALDDGLPPGIVCEAAREMARRRNFTAWGHVLGDLQVGAPVGRQPAPFAPRQDDAGAALRRVFADVILEEPKP